MLGKLTRRFEFELSFGEFMKMNREPCTYCGAKYREYNVRGRKLYCNGIDRIDSDKSYTLDNIVTCCRICNRAKNTLTIEEWYDWLNDIVSHNKEMI